MEKIINSNKKIGAVWIFLFLISIVNASGVATPYWDENPLRMYPGESATIELVLQNMAGGPNDIILRAEISSDRDIATLVEEDNEYLVPFGRNDIKVPIKIEIPEDIENGGVREISVSFKQIANQTGGMVEVISATTTKIVVEIVGVEESTFFQPTNPVEGGNYISWIIGVIILGLIITWIIKKRKGKKFHYNPKDNKYFQKHQQQHSQKHQQQHSQKHQQHSQKHQQQPQHKKLTKKHESHQQHKNSNSKFPSSKDFSENFSNKT